MGLHQFIWVGKQVQTKFTNISLAVILSMSGLAGSAPLFLTQRVAAAETDIVINEVFPATGSANKWVELYNNSSEPLSLNNWRLYRGSGNWGTVFDSTTTIPGNGHLYFESTSSSLPLNSNGSPIELWTGPTSTGTKIDSVDWGSLTAGESYSRTYDGSSSLEATNSPTKGWSNNNYYVSPAGSDTASGGPTSPFATVTKGIDTVHQNGTVNLAAGTYVLNSTLNINKDGIEIIGQNTTILDATSVSGYGILWTADDVTVSNLTLNGSTSGTYGLKIQANPAQGTPFSTPITGVNLSDVTVSGFNVNEVDLHFVNGAVLTNVTADGSFTNGVGIAATDSMNIQIINATTMDNVWGGVAMYTGGCCVVPGGSSNITITNLDSNELNPFYVEEENSGVFDFGSLNAPQFTHTVQNSLHRPDGAEFTYYQQTESEAVAFAAILQGAPFSANMASVVHEIGGSFVVGDSMSIQTAVDAASANDTIQVLSGTYAETVTVNKTLSLLGAQNSVDARTRMMTPESVMNASGGAFSITANNVVIDGFTIQDVTGAPLGTGIYLGASTSGVQIRNNIIQDNIFGLYLNGNSQTVEQNLFRDNNQPGSASGDAIYSDQGLQNSTVQNNYFSGHSSAAIVVAGTANSNITFSNNELQNDNSIVFFNSTSVLIEDNDIANTSGSAVFLGGNNDGAIIQGNSIIGDADSPSTGISISNFSVSPNQNVDITGNTITDRGRGISIAAGSYTGTLDVHLNSLVGNNLATTNAVEISNAAGVTVDANDNWWGSNLGASTSLFSGSVDVSSWCADDTCTPPFLSATTGNIVTLTDTPVDLFDLFDGTQSVLPDSNDVVLNSLSSNASLTIVGGTTVTPASPGWDGKINPPTVLSDTSVSIPTPTGFTTTVATVIELGSSGTTLNFDIPVRLLIPGQAGAKVGFVPVGSTVFTEITAPCGFDDLIDATILFGLSTHINECKIDIGNDLVIWTNHLTKFVAYNQTAILSSTSGSPTSNSTGGTFIPPFFAAASNGVLGSSSAAPQTSSTATEDMPAVAQTTPVRSNAGKLLGLMWYWWPIIVALAGAALYGIYRMADTTERS